MYSMAACLLLGLSDHLLFFLHMLMLVGISRAVQYRDLALDILYRKYRDITIRDQSIMLF